MDPVLKAGRLLAIAPAVSSCAAETHSALVLSQETFEGRVVFEGSVCTVEQLRTGAAANPWETAWLVWNYADNDHFYYFSLKPNGWELGKRDPAYEGGQRFLATGDSMTLDIGAWNRFSVVQDGDHVSISIDGVEVLQFRDLERPYVSGRIGIYSEDARVLLDDVAGSVRDDFDGLTPAPLTDGSHLGDTWEVAFLGYGAGGVEAGESPQIARPDVMMAEAAASPVAPGATETFIPFELPSAWEIGWLVA